MPPYRTITSNEEPDKFSKDFLETLLSPYGTVVVSKEVTSEIQEIDVYFSPNTEAIPPQLGLLGKLCQNPCLLEPYRNGITLDGINDCLSKRFASLWKISRIAKRLDRQSLRLSRVIGLR